MFAKAFMTVLATVPAGDPAVGLVQPIARIITSLVPSGAIVDRAVCAVTSGGMAATQ